MKFFFIKSVTTTLSLYTFIFHLCSLLEVTLSISHHLDGNHMSSNYADLAIPKETYDFFKNGRLRSYISLPFSSSSNHLKV